MVGVQEPEAGTSDEVELVARGRLMVAASDKTARAATRRVWGYLFSVFEIGLCLVNGTSWIYVKS